MMETMVRQLKQKDIKTLERLLEIQFAAYREEARLLGVKTLPPLKEKLKDLQATRDTILIDEVKGEITGALFLEEKCGSYAIAKLFVDPAKSRQGIGRRLVEAALRECAGSRVRVFTGEANEPAVRLYESLGFEIRQRLEAERGLHLVGLERKS